MTPDNWQRVEEIFDAALRLSGGERAAFVRRACAGDAGLLTEVGELLAAHTQADDFMAEPELQLGLSVLGETHSTMRAGDCVAQYTIRRLLGHGGMGEVYLAHDATLGRRVALKLLPHALTSDPDRVRRFRQEARAASLVTHANVAQVFEVGETGGRHFIALEFVDGITLRERLEASPPAPGEALAIARQVAAALTAAHAAGVVHRDLKPENVMLRRDGQVKVLDFGLAKLTGRLPPVSPSSGRETYAGHQLTNLVNTEPGLLMGTATYMSPEQARGQEVDTRADVWSLGVLLYEMLAGVPPFRGATNMDTIAALLTAEPPAPVQRDPEEPDMVWQVIKKSLRKDPAGRYQSAEEMAAELDRITLSVSHWSDRASGSATAKQVTRGTFGAHAGTLTPGGRTAARSRQTRLLRLTVACLLLLGGAAWLGAARWGRERASRDEPPPNAVRHGIRSVAVLPFRSSDTAAEDYIEVGMADALISRLGGLGQIIVRPTGSVRKYARRDVDPVEAGRELKVDAVLEGDIHKVGDQLRVTVRMVDVRSGELVWTDSFDEKFAGIFKVQELISTRVTQALVSKTPGGERRLPVGQTRENAEAYRAYLRGQFHFDRDTEEEMVKAARYFGQAIELDPAFAPPYIGLADYYGQGYGEAKAMTYGERMEKVEALTRRALELDESLTAAHVSLASVLMHYDWDWAGAERAYRRALELNPNYARAHHSYAYYLVFTGRFDEAIAAIRRAEEINPVSIRIGRDIGTIYLLSGRYDEALLAFERAYELDREQLSIRMNRGGVFQLQKKYDEAISEYRAAVLIDPSYLDAYASLGQVYGLTGRKAQALRTLAEMRRRAGGREIWTYYLVKVYAGLGDRERAFEWLEKGMRDRSIGVRLKVDPFFNELRGDPRFAELIRRVGFPD